MTFGVLRYCFYQVSELFEFIIFTAVSDQEDMDRPLVVDTRPVTTHPTTDLTAAIRRRHLPGPGMTPTTGDHHTPWTEDLHRPHPAGTTTKTGVPMPARRQITTGGPHHPGLSKMFC